ncbi:MAG: diguanylate cyclase [Armatimonadota bacterium]|nr:diguanylate cyclase [Armatimonadota bacterium]
MQTLVIQHTGAELDQYTAELREKTAHLEADLNLARELQLALLPQTYPTFPRAVTPEESALRFCHHYRPNTALCGDFFHVLPLSDTTAGVFICDVMGHGVRAALVTAMVRALIEELRPAAVDPSRFLTELNRSLMTILRRTRTPMFLSAFYCVVDVVGGQMHYADAGHPAPLHVRRTAGVVEPLCAAEHGLEPGLGPALGVFADSFYPTCQCTLAVDDLVLLLTDGLFEVEGQDGEYYDQERLLAAVQRRLGLKPAPLFDELLDEIQQFAGQREFEDDMCLVGIEVARLGLCVQSIRDSLTGLFNQRYLEESLEREMHRAERNGYPVGMIMLDIDHFNLFNQMYGREAGDALLRELGGLLRQQTRRSDLACRYGGEEFILILPEASLENTFRKAERLRHAVKEIMLQHHPQAMEPITISLGVASFPDNGATGEAVLRAADTALHRAKLDGCDRVMVA